MDLFSFANLPLEIHHVIAQYLGVVEYFNISQTCDRLRQNFHPLLFTNISCSKNSIPPKSPSRFHKRKNDDSSKKTLSFKWPVSYKALISPDKYKWFESDRVKVLWIDSLTELEISKLIKIFPAKKYSKLESIRPSLYEAKKLMIYGHGETPLKLSTIQSKGATIYLIDLTPFFQTTFSSAPLTIVKRSSTAFQLLQRGTHALTHRFHRTDTKYIITSFVLDLPEMANVDLDSGFNLSSALLDMDSFPNLIKVALFSSETTSSILLDKFVSKILPNSPKLCYLSIGHHCNTSSMKNLRLLNNLSGDWKKFELELVLDFPLNFRLRLPSVTDLMIESIQDDSSYSKMEFCSEKLRYAYLPYSDNSNPFKSVCVDTLLENLTSITLVLMLGAVKDFKEEFHIFKRDLPKLKVLTFDTQFIREYEKIDPSEFDELFLRLKIAPFGDFDVLNIDHMKPLLTQIAAYLEKVEEDEEEEEEENATSPKLSDVRPLLIETIIRFIKNRNFLGVITNYYWLLLQHHLSRVEELFDNRILAIRNIFISVLCEEILHYLPNLEILNFAYLNNFEDYPTLHRLMKHHNGLKKICIDDMYCSYFDGVYKTDDEFFNSVCEVLGIPFLDRNDLFFMSTESRPIVIDMDKLHHRYHVFN